VDNIGLGLPQSFFKRMLLPFDLTRSIRLRNRSPIQTWLIPALAHKTCNDAVFTPSGRPTLDGWLFRACGSGVTFCIALGISISMERIPMLELGRKMEIGMHIPFAVRFSSKRCVFRLNFLSPFCLRFINLRILSFRIFDLRLIRKLCSSIRTRV
jgi:hypothetical protein